MYSNYSLYEILALHKKTFYYKSNTFILYVIKPCFSNYVFPFDK